MGRRKPLLAAIASFLILFILAACTVPAPGPTPVSTSLPAATLEPTALATTIPISVIEPIQLPTTVPNQAVLIKEAKRPHTVDFVIDTQQLENGGVPWWFGTRSAWYKYTSPEGAFSVLMRGGFAPEESTLNGLLGPSQTVAKVVKADYLAMEYQVITYLEFPTLMANQSTPEEVLESLDLAQFVGDAANIEVVTDHRIQLNDVPGRDLLLQVAAKDKPDSKIEMHVRFYAMGNTVYQLTFAGFGTSAHETEERFMNSFTLHASAR